jgi:hypothetical protein
MSETLTSTPGPAEEAERPGELRLVRRGPSPASAPLGSPPGREWMLRLADALGCLLDGLGPEGGPRRPGRTTPRRRGPPSRRPLRSNDIQPYPGTNAFTYSQTPLGRCGW